MSRAAETYAGHRPKILLETLSARPATAILAATYLAFIFSCTFDVMMTLRSFRTGVTQFSSARCPEWWTPEYHSMLETEGTYGCAIYGYDGSVTFLGKAGNLSNVISVSLRAHNQNSSSMFNETEIIGLAVNYDVSLFACAQNGLCSESGNFKSSWQPVLDLPAQEVPFLDFLAPNERDANLIIFGNMFQNQESLPVRGMVQSYFFIVQFTDLHLLFTEKESEVYYSLSTMSRPYIFSEAVTRLVLLVVTVVIFVYFCTKNYLVVPSISKWVPERVWIIWYFIALILYQNPLYFLATWMSWPPTGLVYAAYLVDAFGQSAFFVIWLLFADATHRRLMNAFDFYAPKVCLGLLIFAVNGAVISIQFPSMDTSSSRNPLTAVTNWPAVTKYAFIGLYIVFSLLLFIWFIFWAQCLFKNGSTLQKLPYINTRYLQLSFRFFFIQASLATLYYIFEYAVLVYFISENSTWHQNLNSVTDNMNTLFRYQTQLLGKLIFLTVYAIILAFLFLPPGDGAASALSTAYVVTERELEETLKLRHRALKSQAALSKITQLKADIYCIDISLDLLEASHEAYYDPDGNETVSGYGPCNWESFGYEIIDTVYDGEFDTYCCIAKSKSRNRIVVAFRGSACQKHWKGNFNFTQMQVDIASLTLPELDAKDSLGDVDLDFKENWPEENTSAVRQTSQDEGVAATLREIAHSVVDATETVVDATSSAVLDATSTVVSTTKDLIVAAASHTPGLDRTVAKYLHSGFWSAYRSVRWFVHETLRREMLLQSQDGSRAPIRKIYFTGHSLGGALASLAALDFEIHSRSRINRYLSWVQRDQMVKHPPVTIGTYTFGSPKVGNWVVAQLYDRLVPDTFRIVVDGDVVCATPPITSYVHVGTEVVVDGQGAGSIIIDPSFVERRLHTSTLTSFRVHLLSNYRQGIRGVRNAAIFMQSYASNLAGSDEDIDPLEIAFNAVIEHIDKSESDISSQSSDSEKDVISAMNSQVESERKSCLDSNISLSLEEHISSSTIRSSARISALDSDETIAFKPGLWASVFLPRSSLDASSSDSVGLTSSHGLLTGDISVQRFPSSHPESQAVPSGFLFPTLDSLKQAIYQVSDNVHTLLQPVLGSQSGDRLAVEQMINDANAVSRRPKKNSDQNDYLDERLTQ